MRISQVRAMLEEQEKRVGDIECTMIGTVLPEGMGSYSSEPNTGADVFESTICSTVVRENTPGWPEKRLLVCWQT